jgi:hypothetical protein
MKPIKTPSFEAIDNLSNLIFKHLNEKVELQQIKRNVSHILFSEGATNFVLLYNIATASKNYGAFTKNLK